MVDLTAIRPSQASRPVSERARAAEGTARAPETDGAGPTDKVTISPEARAQRAANGGDRRDGQASQDGKQRQDGKLTAEQLRQVSWLQQRDVHVRQHEAAHQAAGGSLTGGASFSFQVGPDGRSYAVGGEVPVRLETGRTPDETIANARQARRAALAPSDPSAADLAVAAAATELEQSALAQRARFAAKAYGKQAKQPGDEPVAGGDGAAGGAGGAAGTAAGAARQASLESDNDAGPQGATLVAA